MNRHLFRRWLREPVLHFVLLGTVLFLAQSQWGTLLVREKIHISAEHQKILQQRWLAQTGRQATDAEMAALLRQTIDEEILLREAHKLGLPERDPVVRERLIRNMRFIEQDSKTDEARLLKAAISLGMVDSDTVIRRRLLQLMRHRIESDVRVTQSDLLRYFEKQSDNLQKPARYSFSQVYLKSPAGADIETTRQALALGTPFEQLGDVFLLGQRFQRMTRAEVERQLGQAVADKLTDSPTGNWTGPVASVYGQHFLRLDTFEPAQQTAYEQAGPRLAARLYTERESTALRNRLNVLRSRYRIRIEGSA